MDSIIFDLDGTLWDSTETVVGVWNEVIREHGIHKPDITVALLKSLFGRPMPDIAAVVFAEVDRPSQLKMLDQCCARENERLLKQGSLTYPNIEETLKYLSAKYPLFIVSNCQAGYIDVFCKSTGLGEYFQDNLCPDDTGMTKAANILEIMKRHNLKNPVYVGDTDGDYQASKSAGIPFIYASYGFGELTDVDCQIDSLNDLTKMF